MRIVLEMRLNLERTSGPTLSAAEVYDLVADALDAELPGELWLAGADNEDESEYRIMDVTVKARA